MPQAAEQIESSPAITTRAAFVEEARKYLGVRWQHQGRSILGVDCVGLLVMPAIALGVLTAEQDVRDYGRQQDGQELTRLLHQHCHRLTNWKEAREGDILAIKYDLMPQHVAIVTRAYRPQWGFHVIHAFGNAEMPGTVVEHRLDKAWLTSHRAKIHAAFWIKGVGETGGQGDKGREGN
jgi:hypothetical protein